MGIWLHHSDPYHFFVSIGGKHGIADFDHAGVENQQLRVADVRARRMERHGLKDSHLYNP